MNASLLLLLLMAPGLTGERPGWSTTSIAAPGSIASVDGPGAVASVSGRGTTVTLTLATDATSSATTTTEATVS
mgnify:CR=1 FL=1